MKFISAVIFYLLYLGLLAGLAVGSLVVELTLRALLWLEKA
jgi:hypothetical protein